MALRPTFANIRTGSFLADRHKIIIFNNFLGFCINSGLRPCTGRLGTNPRGLAQNLTVRTIGFFRMAGAFIRCKIVYNHCHKQLYISICWEF